MQPKATFHFPKNFQWGATYPNYQTVNHIVNNNWENWLNITPEHHLKSINSWQGWKDDFERAQTLNLKTLILNVDWSRVQRTADSWDENVIEHYRSVVIALLEKNIKPFIILQHFSEPIWFFEKGGWGNDESVNQYLAFVEKVVTALKEYCNYWITFYEPNLYIYNAYLSNKYPPGSTSVKSAFRVYLNIIRAHKMAYDRIHMIQDNANVSISSNIRYYTPARSRILLDYLMIPIHQNLFNHLVSVGLKFTKKPGFSKFQKNSSRMNFTDFTLFSFYGDQEIKFSPKHSIQTNNLDSSDGLNGAIKWAAAFKKPVYIVGTNHNSSISNFLLKYLHTIWKTANLNPYIQGYFYHSLIDGFEWDKNFDPLYGLFGLNHNNYTRLERSTVELLKNITYTNSISYELVNQCSRDLINQLFP